MTLTAARADAPVDTSITLEALHRDPYPIYRRLRAEAPVLRVEAVKRIMLTKAADTRFVKDNPELFSSDDPHTPMRRAFQAHTLMRKDGEAHAAERGAMAPAFAPKCIMGEWAPRYARIAEEYVARLPKGEVVDLFQALAAPYAARGLAELLGVESATDEQMIRWSQTLIDGAGNFGFREELFAVCDAANAEMNALFDAEVEKHLVEKGPSALSVMVNAAEPIARSQIYSNIKIAVGGGINEPRDALCTILYALLSDPAQKEYVTGEGKWVDAFEEGVRWVAPIQASSRRATEDVEIRGIRIPKGEVVMTIQASACRDEEVYGETAEVYDVFRPKAPHQAFGNGPHFCQGTHVARRMLAHVMLPLLFERFPNMALAGEVPWHGFGFRGPIALPVRLA